MPVFCSTFLHCAECTFPLTSLVQREGSAPADSCAASSRCHPLGLDKGGGRAEFYRLHLINPTPPTKSPSFNERAVTCESTPLPKMDARCDETRRKQRRRSTDRLLLHLRPRPPPSVCPSFAGVEACGIPVQGYKPQSPVYGPGCAPPPACVDGMRCTSSPWTTANV
mmetsp:Transcript_26914/g.48410  ORF Transcript_26914/g.48410 Transcript_26914/m.48410 type:complete len:167 (-) Transcript_26914:705-1205(-)